MTNKHHLTLKAYIMNILKKISLIILGIFISLILLEAGLQIAGFALTTVKNYQNKKFKNSNTITVLCLGESTTDDQWPPILQKILNEKYKNIKFNVIDEGLAGTNTGVIYYKINEYMSIYKPDIVVSMMGINDTGLGYIKYKIKLFNLFQLIKKHSSVFLCKDLSYVNFHLIDEKAAQLMLVDGNYAKAEKIYLRLIKNKYRKSHILNRLCFLYYQTGKFDKLDSIINTNKNIPYDGNCLQTLIVYLTKNKQYSFDQIKNWIRLNKDKILYDSANIYVLKQYHCEELISYIKNNINDNYPDMPDTKEITTQNYQNIINVIEKYNSDIKILAMQYPILPIDDLKNMLKDSQYYEKLVFISNEENFKEALKKYKTEAIFTDMFKGNFGHCTALGNTLIAENVAKTIEKIIKK